MKLVLVMTSLILSNIQSQLMCEPGQDCIIDCKNIAESCYSQTINASQATSLTLYCNKNEDDTCRSSTILCPLNDTARCDIICSGQSSCTQAVINSQQSSILNLHCDYIGSCSQITVFGSLLSTNIYCNSLQSCFLSEYNLNQTPNVTLHCTGYDSCYRPNLHVENSEFVTVVINNINNRGNENTDYLSIYGSNIKERLIFDCSGYHMCQFVDVHCPKNAECIINIYDDNYVDFHIVNASYSNLYLNIKSPPGSYASYDILCDDSSLRTEISYDTTYNEWYCLDDNCCPNSYKSKHVINCKANQECIIDCNNLENGKSCGFTTINASLSTSLTVYCNYANSCQGSSILCPNGECNIICSDIESCRYTMIESYQLLNKIDLICSNEDSCERIIVNVNMNTNSNANIICSGSSSCGYAYFNINGNNNTSNATFICSGEYACDPTIFNATNMNIISLDCTNEDSCFATDIYGFTSNKLNAKCNYNDACYKANIYCPSYASNICSIQCGDYDSSCQYVDIYVNDDSYSDQYLDIECPINSINSDQCDDIEFYCPSSKTSLIYDYINDLYACSDNMCCPYQQWIRTKSPTTIPTVATPTPTYEYEYCVRTNDTIKYGGNGGEEAIDITIHQGKINQIVSWGLSWGLMNFGWSSALELKSVIYAGGDAYTNCTAFKLNNGDYINGYRVIYSNSYILGLVFYTFRGAEYKCIDQENINKSHVFDSGEIRIYNHYLSGFYIRFGDIIDQIGFQFTLMDENNICDGLNEFVLIQSRKSWYDAELFCNQQFGTNLASIINDEELIIIEALKNNYDMYESIWIGLTDNYNVTNLTEGEWIWVDETLCDYVESGLCINDINWADGEPNNFDGNQHCAVLWPQNEFDDTNCNDKNVFLCNAQTSSPTRSPITRSPTSETLNPTHAPTNTPTNEPTKENTGTDKAGNVFYPTYVISIFVAAALAAM